MASRAVTDSSPRWKTIPVYALSDYTSVPRWSVLGVGLIVRPASWGHWTRGVSR